MNTDKPSYDDLINIIKDKDFEISRLLSKTQSISNFDFYHTGSKDLICIAGFEGFLRR